MTFFEFYVKNGSISEKGITHDYIRQWYSPEFTPRKDEHLTIVELGVFRGDGVRLFKDWFQNARVVGIDPLVEVSFGAGVSQSTQEELLVHKDIEFIFKDAYTLEVVNMFEDESIDYLIDDGPHTLDSQLWGIEYYFPKIKKGGVIVVEDIQDIHASRKDFQDLATRLNVGIEIIENTNRKFDSVLVIIRK
jgi:hypothetical protein